MWNNTKLYKITQAKHEAIKFTAVANEIVGLICDIFASSLRIILHVNFGICSLCYLVVKLTIIITVCI